MVKKSKLIKFVSSYLGSELDAVKGSPIANTVSILSIEERALIYKYSEDGYENLNKAMRKNRGKNNTEFGKLLDNALKKLPNYKGLTYRSADLTKPEIEKYLRAFEKNTILVEYSFISTSKSIAIANMFGKNCQFAIISKTAKEIEGFAKYGLYSGQNEREILFRPNVRFAVLEVTKRDNLTLILMEELTDDGN